MAARILYSDLDGTMVGRGGSFFRGREFGSTTLEPAQALVALHEAGVVLSLVSGRTRAQLQEAARIFGADGFIAEMGAIIAPPLPAFYARPQSLEEMVDQSVGRALDLFGLDWKPVKRWGLDVGPVKGS